MQRSFDDLGTPLVDVTFCVVDLETTGATPATCAITEIGAVKVRGGEVLGIFHTLVNPGSAIPPEITVLTGITQAMVLRAPRIAEVLPAFVEFAAGTVLVGHNVRFDAGFLDAALQQHAWPRLDHRLVDTCALARRLVREEVPNCKLGTLASRFRLDHQPSHRALDDALATTDLLHLLLERAGTLGVLGLDDLLALPTMAGHPQAQKLKLTQQLPRCPGVYLFEGPRGEVLYVGKATNLRARVRSYFSGDDRRKVGALLREVKAIRHIACGSTLEAAVTEVRLIQEHRPRYNRQAKHWESYAYLSLTLAEAWPRLAVVKEPKADGSLHLGPLPSQAAARLAAEAILSAVPLRRCSTPLGKSGRVCRSSPCTPAQLGVAPCPCAGQADPRAYADAVQTAVRGLTESPRLLLDPLRSRMEALAAAGRYEEAADVRDRAGALALALTRQRRADALRQAGLLRVRLPSGQVAEVRNGVLVRVGAGDPADTQLALDVPEPDVPDPDRPLPRRMVDEVSCVAGWLEAEAHRLRIEHVDAGLSAPIPALPSFAPGRSVSSRR
jgi:DNA polymerase III subunit epsilon